MGNNIIAGIDIGSRSIELVLIKDNNLIHKEKTATTFEPLSQIKKLLANKKPHKVIATGYGRNLVAENDIGTRVETITEIKAYALGTNYFFPEAKTILDIGGQDTKAISLTSSGKVIKFEMNDRCSAGTGKFLEHVANIFQIPVRDFGTYALKGNKILSINSMCTVFAETEATSLMAQGHDPKNIALGLHMSIVKRTTNMLSRVGLEFPLVFAGGVAKNRCVVNLLRDSIKKEPVIPEEPDMIGAYGAALFGINSISI